MSTIAGQDSMPLPFDQRIDFGRAQLISGNTP
jgi:hypothetical protein